MILRCDQNVPVASHREFRGTYRNSGFAVINLERGNVELDGCNCDNGVPASALRIPDRTYNPVFRTRSETDDALPLPGDQSLRLDTEYDAGMLHQQDPPDPDWLKK